MRSPTALPALALLLSACGAPHGIAGACRDDRECPRNAECNEIPDGEGLRGCEPVL